jgi:hypothetical protein
MPRTGDSGERTADGDATSLPVVGRTDEVGRRADDVRAAGPAALGREPGGDEDSHPIATPPTVGPLLAGVRAVHPLATRAKLVQNGSGAHGAAPFVIPIREQFAEWAVECELRRHTPTMRRGV